jgi:hypothetical protein
MALKRSSVVVPPSYRLPFVSHVTPAIVSSFCTQGCRPAGVLLSNRQIRMAKPRCSTPLMTTLVLRERHWCRNWNTSVVTNKGTVTKYRKYKIWAHNKKKDVPLKTNINLDYIYRFSSYRAVNTVQTQLEKYITEHVTLLSNHMVIIPLGRTVTLALPHG